MRKISLKQFAGKIKYIERQNVLGKMVEDCLDETAKESVSIVRRSMNRSEDEKGRNYPLIASRYMYRSVRYQKGSGVSPRGRIVAMVGTDAPYAEAMEFGAVPHKAPLDKLLIWARYKVGSTKRRSTAGKERGERLNSRKRGDGSQREPKGNRPPKLNKAASKKALRLAYAAQKKIAKSGIHPRFFMARSIPSIQRKLRIKLGKAKLQKEAQLRLIPVRIRIRRIP